MMEINTIPLQLSYDAALADTVLDDAVPYNGDHSRYLLVALTIPYDGNRSIPRSPLY